MSGIAATAAVLLLTFQPLVSASIPAGAELNIRLKDRVGSLSKPGEAVEAVLIAPVVLDNRIVLHAGAAISGTVKSASPAGQSGERATLQLSFSEIHLPGGEPVALAAKVKEVGNARETVDENGQVLGIVASETLTARMDKGLEKLSGRLAKFASILQTAKNAVLDKADAEITYGSGVELSLTLEKPLEIPSDFPAPPVGPVEPEAELYDLVNTLPFQTTAEKPPKPSDITNLMYIGSREQLERAFAEAGWTTAETLNAQSGLETFRAVVENRGYKEAPMSILLLDGKKPEMVFQKQLNTFAERHHLRIFERPERFQGRPVWVCAATHDTGIAFSPENRTFIHLIDGKIDGERAKVVADLLFTGRVEGLALVERPAVPKHSENATGDKLETDGAMAVLLLK